MAALLNESSVFCSVPDGYASTYRTCNGFQREDLVALAGRHVSEHIFLEKAVHSADRRLGRNVS
jgi:hypothetical protein